MKPENAQSLTTTSDLTESAWQEAESQATRWYTSEEGNFEPTSTHLCTSPFCIGKVVMNFIQGGGYWTIDHEYIVDEWSFAVHGIQRIGEVSKFRQYEIWSPGA